MAKSDVLVRMKADTSGYDANIAKARRQLDQFKNDNLSMGGALKQLSGSLVGAAAGFASITAAVGAATAAISSNIETAKNFEKSMSQLSSLTGKVGEDLNKLKEYAIDLGGSTTLTASQVADAFKMIGSQQPQLLASSEALKAVTKNAITLAEAAGIELATAAQTLSTSINQMGGDSNNAERYINVLAAASQKGAGDIAWLGEAITKSATAAKAVGTDYEELVANLEQLAKAGFDASTAGTALRSIIMNLEKQANQDFKPSIVGLTQAFENLGKANLTITQYQEIAGKMFASQAMALANAAGEAKHMREEITGTNTAEEQAKTNTDNLDGSLKSLSSAWEALNLHINSSNGFLKSSVDWLKEVVKWADQTFTAAGRAAAKLAEMQGGGNGNPTKVDRQISALGGSNFKQQKYNSQLAKYDQDIRVAEYYKRKYSEAGWTGGSVLSDVSRRFGVKAGSSDDIDNIINSLRTAKDEYMSRAKQILNPGSGDGSNTNQTITIDADTEPATMSIKELQAEIKKLKKLRDDAADEGNFEMRDKYNADIKSVQAQIKAMRGGGSDSTKKELDDLQQVQKKIADLTKEAYTADEGRQAEIQKEIAGLQAQEQKLIKIRDLVTGKAEPKELAIVSHYDTGDVSDGQAMIDKIKGDLAQANIDEDMKRLSQMMADGLRAGLQEQDLTDIATELKRKIMEGGDVPDEVWQEFEEYIQENLDNADFSFNINFNEKSAEEAAKKQKKEAAEMAKDWQAAGNAINAVGQAMQQIEDPAAKVMGTIAQAVASVALGASQAIAQAGNGSAGGPWGWIAFAAAATATMIGTIASIHNATGYANGGIVDGSGGGFVGGTAYSGDNIGNVRLDAGELVLSRSQQGNLAEQLEGSSMQNMQLETRLGAEEIIFVLNNNANRRGYKPFIND